MPEVRQQYPQVERFRPAASLLLFPQSPPKASKYPQVERFRPAASPPLHLPRKRGRTLERNKMTACAWRARVHSASAWRRIADGFCPRIETHPLPLITRQLFRQTRTDNYQNPARRHGVGGSPKISPVRPAATNTQLGGGTMCELPLRGNWPGKDLMPPAPTCPRPASRITPARRCPGPC